MGSGDRRGARWVVAILAVALVCSAVVVYALVRITAPSGDSPQLTSDATTSTGAAVPTRTGDTPVSGTGSVASSTPTDDVVPSTPTTGAPSLPPDSSMHATPLVPETTTRLLPDSDVVLPAAWTGVAKVTVTVLGECAASNSSVYADLPADLALDLVQNEANAAQTPLPDGAAGDEPTLTLGVNSSGVPSIALYSSQIDDTGLWQRYWDLQLEPGKDRTEIHGTLVAQPDDGSTPNMMVDAETSLQPCASLGTVSLPRALADGATLQGWLTVENASLTLTATTTDGKRTVTVEVTAQRAH